MEKIERMVMDGSNPICVYMICLYTYLGTYASSLRRLKIYAVHHCFGSLTTAPGWSLVNSLGMPCREARSYF